MREGVADPELPDDPAERPAHYLSFKFEPVHFIVENFGAGWIVGNIIKYVMRYPKKKGIEDLRKAKRYLEMLIKFESGDKDWWK